MTVVMWIVLIISIVVNALLLWYISYALRKLLYISENIGGLLEKAEDFAKHLEGVHELETFYGDTTLQGLIVHSKELVEDIRQFEEVYELVDEDEGIEKVEEEDE